MGRRIGYRRKGKGAHEKGCSRFPYRGVMGVMIRAPAAAVKAVRDRGPFVTHRRAKEQAAEAAAAEQKAWNTSAEGREGAEGPVQRVSSGAPCAEVQNRVVVRYPELLS